MSEAIRQFINSIPSNKTAFALRKVYDLAFPNNLDTALTASVTQTQAGALVLRGDCVFHEITTSATAGNAVSLPYPKQGMFHFVKNSAAANAIQVYAATPGTIESVATATGVAQEHGDGVLYFCLIDGNYIRLGGMQATEAFTTLSATTISMNDGGYVDFSNAAVAAAGNGQSTYTVIADQINAVTGADGTKGVALPAASAGRAVFVVNTDQTNTLKVAPINAGNDTINSLTAGTGVFTMGPARAAWFIPTSATQWYVTGDAAIVGTPTEQDLDGLTASATELNYNDITTLGTLAASKAWTSDANLDTVMPTGGLLTVQSGGAVTMSSGSTTTLSGAVVQAPVFVADATPYAVLAADSGKLHIILEQANTITLNLPAIAAGLSYKFVMGGVATEAQNWVIVATTPSYYNGGVSWDDSNAVASPVPVYANGTSHLTLTATTPEAGTEINIFSNGTEWFVHGAVFSTATPAFT
ncbi:MAG: hypothetical protein WC073_11365 [Sterolibacterium sp.]